MKLRDLIRIQFSLLNLRTNFWIAPHLIPATYLGYDLITTFNRLNSDKFDFDLFFR